MRAVCPGSFDPVTHGHLDIMNRAAGLFDEVIVAVGRNSSKNYLFTSEERIAMVEQSCAGLTNIRVTRLDGLLVDFCRLQGCDVVVKGLRFASDFEFELQMAQMNHAMTGIETVLLPTSARWAHLSSSMIREIALLGGDVAQFVTPEVATQIATKVVARRLAE